MLLAKEAIHEQPSYNLLERQYIQYDRIAKYAVIVRFRTLLNGTQNN